MKLASFQEIALRKAESDAYTDKFRKFIDIVTSKGVKKSPGDVSPLYFLVAINAEIKGYSLLWNRLTYSKQGMYDKYDRSEDVLLEAENFLKSLNKDKEKSLEFFIRQGGNPILKEALILKKARMIKDRIEDEKSEDVRTLMEIYLKKIKKIIYNSCTKDKFLQDVIKKIKEEIKKTEEKGFVQDMTKTFQIEKRELILKNEI